MDNFSFLDQQLVQLLLRLCAEQGCKPDQAQQKLLDQLVHQLSAATRAGTIAVALNDFEPEVDLKLLENLPVIGLPGSYQPLIVEDGHIWLNRYWQYEQRLAHNLLTRLQTMPELAATPLSRTATDIQTATNTEQPDWQQRAIDLAAHSHFSIISGGPGTGKTTTITRLLWLLTEQSGISPNRILLAAPTGKAAMRLQESIRQVKSRLNIPTAQADNIPEQASTLHRLLGYIPGKAGFRYNKHHLLPADVVIVDEASMIDISLMTQLAEAVPAQARLILLGDKDQLAAVETGSVFRDLCSKADNQHEDHIVVLQKSWRFAANSGIGQLAAAVRDGQDEKLKELLQQDWPDIHWTADSSLNTQALMQSWQNYFALLNQPPRQAQDYQAWLDTVFSAFNRFRILTPLQQGPFGTEQLNQKLAQSFSRNQQSSASNNQWYNGRPVMVTRNDYRQQLFNGDIGLTLRDHRGELRVWFQQEDGFRAISPIRLPDHETAWVMTIHKSQGSEFEEVLLLLPDDEDIRILGRELLYTGITRAKSRVQLRGRLEVLQSALRQVTPPSSRIRQRLEKLTAQIASTPTT